MHTFESAMGRDFDMKKIEANAFGNEVSMTTPPGTPPTGRGTPDNSVQIPATPETYLKPSWYHNMDEIIREVDQYFLDRWNFASEKERKKFVVAGFSRVTCMYYPMADDDRIASACKLLTILFLIDGE
jgi:aristolochene synthase